MTSASLTRTPSPAVPALVAAGSLLTGFGVAQATGVRDLGGVVLLAGAGWAGREWVRHDGAGTAAALLGVMAAAFVGSHVLAKQVGAWPSVALAAAATGGAAWALTRRRA